MNKILIEQTATPELRKRAWKVLVKELGIVDALRFVMATEPGERKSEVGRIPHASEGKKSEVGSRKKKLLHFPLPLTSDFPLPIAEASFLRKVGDLQ